MIQQLDTPHRINFSHFKILRKIITHQLSGVLLFQTSKGIEAQLFFKNGKVYCAHQDDGSLLLFLSDTMVFTEWKQGQLQMDACATEHVLLNIINRISWQKENQYAIANMFSTLPNVYADRKQAQFDNFLMNISHDIFQQMSSDKNGIAPSVYLLQHDPSNSLQRYRVKVFTFNYILGFIHAEKSNKRRKKRLQKRLSMLERIKARVSALTMSF